MKNSLIPQQQPPVSKASAAPSSKRAGGRPRKFGEPSRPVTVTLPERILRLLSKVSLDRAAAITKVVEIFAAAHTKTTRSMVEVIQVAPGRALIFVPASQYLARIPWLQLVEVAPARHIMALTNQTPIERLEVTLVDLLEGIPAEDCTEREIIADLLACLRGPRRKQTVAKEEILVLVDACASSKQSTRQT